MIILLCYLPFPRGQVATGQVYKVDLALQRAQAVWQIPGWTPAGQTCCAALGWDSLNQRSRRLALSQVFHHHNIQIIIHLATPAQMLPLFSYFFFFLSLSLEFLCDQTTVNKKVLIHYIIPINDMVHRPLYKNVFKKSTTKTHDKAIQANILWLNLNKISGISTFQSAHKQGNPSFHFHAPGSKRRYPCTQTAPAVPKYFSRLLQFCTGYRIWHASRAWKRKTLIFTQLKRSW